MQRINSVKLHTLTSGSLCYTHTHSWNTFYTEYLSYKSVTCASFQLYSITLCLIVLFNAIS